MINRKYDNLESLFVDAAYVTLTKQNVDLTLDNYSFYFKKALKMIILEKNYRYITSTNNARQKVMHFFGDDSREDFLDIIRYKVGDQLFDRLVPSYSVDANGNKKFKINEILLCIEYYADNILIHYIPDEDFVASKIKENDSTYKQKIQSVKYYSPSNSCKEAILSGKQIQLSHSEENVAGMQAVSDVGKVRKNQEDSYYIGQHPNNPNFKIMLVADGMGGYAGGQYASSLAAKEMLEWFESLDPSEYYQNDNHHVNQMVASQLDKINSDILRKYSGAATTLCFSIVKQDNLYMCNIGDSKGFVMKNGKFIYETKTHNITDSILELPENFGRFHPESNVITHALGMKEQQTHSCFYSNTIPMDKNNDYQVVLCSDGVSDCLNRDQIVDIVCHSQDGSIARNLVNSALNSKSSFQQELENSKRQFGIMGRFNYRKLVDFLRKNGLNEDYEKVIVGGKDNTTAVSGVIKR